MSPLPTTNTEESYEFESASVDGEYQPCHLEPMQGLELLLQAAQAEDEEEASRGIKRKRAPIACDQCRASHLTCNGGGQDCSGCARRGFECKYTPKKAKKAKR